MKQILFIFTLFVFSSFSSSAQVDQGAIQRKIMEAYQKSLAEKKAKEAQKKAKEQYVNNLQQQTNQQTQNRVEQIVESQDLLNSINSDAFKKGPKHNPNSSAKIVGKEMTSASNKKNSETSTNNGKNVNTQEKPLESSSSSKLSQQWNDRLYTNGGHNTEAVNKLMSTKLNNYQKSNTSNSNSQQVPGEKKPRRIMRTVPNEKISQNYGRTKAQKTSLDKNSVGNGISSTIINENSQTHTQHTSIIDNNKTSNSTFQKKDDASLTKKEANSTDSENQTKYTNKQLEYSPSRSKMVPYLDNSQIDPVSKIQSSNGKKKDNNTKSQKQNNSGIVNQKESVSVSIPQQEESASPNKYMSAEDLVIFANLARKHVMTSFYDQNTDCILIGLEDAKSGVSTLGNNNNKIMKQQRKK